MDKTTLSSHFEVMEQLPVDFVALGNRLGQANLQTRLRQQVELEAGLKKQGSGMFKFLHFLRFYDCLRLGLKMSGLWNRGRKNYRDLQVTHHEVSLARLPKAFDGYRILHLTDLHLDIDLPYADIVAERLATVDYDLCLTTGDFRNKTESNYSLALEAARRVCAVIDKPHYASLGNHDSIEKVPALESCGMKFLLNEHSFVEKDGAKLWLAGIDDSHYYRSHDLPRALKGIPEDACVVLLAHCPDVYAQSAAAGIALQLSGHTHGGQIALPGGRPLLTHCHAPDRICLGWWQEGQTRGFTSRGVGACALPVRFNCPPEAAVITLRCT